jgi:hypothetical protein
MTEQEWLECADPDAMLEFVADRITDRKYRYFVTACCRRVWHLLDEAGRKAVETAERYADDPTTLPELFGAARGVFAPDPTPAQNAAFHAVATTGAYSLAATVAAHHAALAVSRSSQPPADEPDPGERAWQCQLIREIFGNPFRPVAVDPAWLAHGDGAVVTMARGIHAGRSFGDLPVLADALLEAGCREESVLAHCRQAGGHVRGCWVVDALLAQADAPRRAAEKEALRQAVTRAVVDSGRETLARLDALLKAPGVGEPDLTPAQRFWGWVGLIVLAVLLAIVCLAGLRR